MGGAELTGNRMAVKAARGKTHRGCARSNNPPPSPTHTHDESREIRERDATRCDHAPGPNTARHRMGPASAHIQTLELAMHRPPHRGVGAEWSHTREQL